MKKILFLVLFLLTNYSFSQNLYVDGANGNNTNSGTSTIQAWKTIQHAFDHATPGSTVYIRGGIYNENISANVSGTPASPITFRNYQNEAVILDGTGTAQNDMLYIENQSNITIKNITIQNKTVNNATGLVISCTSNGSASNITLKNIKISGINWSANPNAIPTSNNNSNPLLVYGQGTNQVNAIANILIDSCEVFNNITGFSEAISLDGNVDSFTVSNNLIHDNKNIGILMGGNYKVSSNQAMDHTRNGRCFQNICYANVSNYATSGGIYVDGGQHIIVERNTSYGNGYGIEIGCEENGNTSDITVRDNLIYNNKEAGLAMGGYTTSTTGQVLNSSVLNNTFLANDYSNSGVGEVYISKMSNCSIQNNIFYTNAQNILISKDNISPQSNNSLNYNCWYTPNNNSNSILVNWGTKQYSSFASYVSGTGMDVNSMYADPKLANNTISNPDVHLLNGSACINSGNPTFVAGANETDYYGGTRVFNSKVDMGAHESSISNFIYENENKNIISVYPNPFSEKAVLSISGLLPANGLCLEIRMYNLHGKLIRILKLVQDPYEDILSTQLDRDNLGSGIYFYNVIAGNKVIGAGKIIIR